MSDQSARHPSVARIAQAVLRNLDKVTLGYAARGIRYADRVFLQAALAKDPALLEGEVAELEEDRSLAVDAEQIAAFKRRYAGKRCFIVGNGPSLNETDLSKLKDELSFGVNGIFYKTEETGFRPTFYVVEDRYVMKDNIEQIAKYKAGVHRFFPTIYRDLVGRTDDTSFFLMNRGFYEPLSLSYAIPRFSTDCARKVFSGQSVTFINLQLALYMGFTEVYLIGVDFKYRIPDSAKHTSARIVSTDADPNHFHPNYFGPGKSWHDPQLDRVRRCFQFANLVYEWHGAKIYNATKGGDLDVFERVDYDSLF